MFNNLHLHQYVKGLLSQVQMLLMYPAENATTLAAAVAARKCVYPAEV